jgi:osmotically-inducible protein OsmY
MFTPHSAHSAHGCKTPEIRRIMALVRHREAAPRRLPTMRSRLIACVFSAAAALSLGGCFAIQEKTFGESLDEAASGTEIKTKLLTGGGPSRFGEVDVEVADRFVLLSGRVPSLADKAEAERLAWSVSSVDEVANELVVDKFDLGRDINDRWITEQVRARIIADSDIKGVNYNIQVFNGVVYLMGFARSEDELRQAAEHASRVKGVQKVDSYEKMRERGTPPPPAPVQYAEPQARDEGPIQIAPAAADPAPIVPPEKPPTTRGQYSDPYAKGATPPPGASSNSLGLQTAPLPPAH